MLVTGFIPVSTLTCNWYAIMHGWQERGKRGSKTSLRPGDLDENGNIVDRDLRFSSCADRDD
jgi:hypothetical protein